MTANPSADTPPPRRYRLSGPSEVLDPRIHAIRRDLADARLAERVFAPHYAVPQPCGVVVAAPLFAEARPGAEPLSEVLPGETFEVLEQGAGRAWGIAADGAVGYVTIDALGAQAEPRFAVATKLAAPVGSGAPLPLGARVAGEVQGETVVTQNGVFARSDLRPLTEPAGDPLAVAETLVGAPHKAGGRSGAGVHCVGLVYLAMTEAARPCARFHAGQSTMGTPVPDDSALRRGDLVTFADHVGLMADGAMLIHAGPAGVVREPLAAIVAGGTFGPVTGRRRP